MLIQLLQKKIQLEELISKVDSDGESVYSSTFINKKQVELNNVKNDIKKYSIDSKTGDVVAPSINS